MSTMSTALLATLVRLQTALVCAPTDHRRCRDDAGQATTEYALILLAAALVGLCIGRSQLPQQYRPRQRDSRYVSVELSTAHALIAAHDEQLSATPGRAAEQE